MTKRPLIYIYTLIQITNINIQTYFLYTFIDIFSLLYFFLKEDDIL